MSQRMRFSDPSWERITAEAKAQVTAELIALAQTSLEFGRPIAWATTAKVGRATDGLSSVHRVGLPQGNVAYTTCNVPIPDPALWFPLSPALEKTLLPCGFCEAEHAQRERSRAWGNAA